MKKPPRYATEADLCADFIAWVKAEAGKLHHGIKTPVWTPYAETADWDILLVAEDGTQIGVQAKLKFNMKVLHQTIPVSWDAWRDTGPDYRAILLPENDGMVDDICSALGITAFYATDRSYYGRGEPDHLMEFCPGLSMEHYRGWHYWSPRKRHELPEFVPDVIAGDSGPVQLTKWKIAALRIVATLEVRGHVTRQDFRTHGIDPRRWMQAGWLVPKSERMQDAGQFVRGAGLDFDRQHPEVYAKVLAEIREKLADSLLAGSTQEAG